MSPSWNEGFLIKYSKFKQGSYPIFYLSSSEVTSPFFFIKLKSSTGC